MHASSSPMILTLLYSFFFFFNDTATTEIYTLSLHDALPISTASGSMSCTRRHCTRPPARAPPPAPTRPPPASRWPTYSYTTRSEEHTSELQSLAYLVCRLLLEKKKKKTRNTDIRQ